MKVLVTGAKGFIGKHLVKGLKQIEDIKVLEFDKNTPWEYFENYCSECDFVYHLAGVNKAISEDDFRAGNVELTNKLIYILKGYKNRCPVFFSSSIHAALNTPYGISKKAAEDLLFSYEKETGVKVYVYRLPNVFGGGCKPDYNSVIATFCHNIARGFSIQLDNPKTILNMVYIDDLVNELIRIINGEADKTKQGIYSMKKVNSLSLGEIADLFFIFKKCQEYHVQLPLDDPFIKKLFDTFISYLPDKENQVE